MTYPVTPAVERFWAKVAFTEGCWIWTAGRFSNGYGQFRVGPDRPAVKAHRFAYELAFGVDPAGKRVCHSCDTPLCVRPEHLWIGSDAENQRDMTSKGRGRVGQRNGRWKHGRRATKQPFDVVGGQRTAITHWSTCLRPPGRKARAA